MFFFQQHSFGIEVSFYLYCPQTIFTPPEMKILVCEDDEIVLKVIQLTLEKENAQTIYVRDGNQAMQQLKSNDFDLIITDIHMPYHNGDEILKLVREEQGKDTPVIMMSSDNQEEVIALALRSGVDEFIEKPIDTNKLRRTLKKYLKV